MASLWCLVLIVCLSMGDGSHITKRIHENGGIFKQVVQKGRCDVTELLTSYAEVYCLGADHSYVDLVSTGYEVEYGVMCKQKCLLSEKREERVCTDWGTWTGQLVECPGTTRNGVSVIGKGFREKRSVAAVAVFSAFAAIFCIFACEDIADSIGNSRNNHNYPPTVICPPRTIPPSPISVHGSHGTAVVRWSQPTVRDHYGNTPRTTVATDPGIFQSGSRFSPGTYTVLYTAVDSAQNTKSCRFSFTVIGVSCQDPPTPPNGVVTCTPRADADFKRVCRLKCDKGYKVPPHGTHHISCQSDGTWDGTLANCVPK